MNCNMFTYLDGANQIGFLKICDEGELILVGTIERFEVHEIKINSKTNKIFSCRSPNVFTAERLPGTHLVTFVSRDQPRDLELYNISRNTNLSTLTYPQDITVVKANRRYAVVGLQDRILVHDTADLRLVREFSHLCGWIDGVLAISKKGNKIAFPDILCRSSVRVCDIESSGAGVSLYTGVKEPPRLLSFNMDGSLLAVAQPENFSLYIYNTTTGGKVFHLRRSVMIRASIQSIVFSGDSRLVAVTSNTASVHMFKLKQERSAVPDSFVEKLRGLMLNDSQNPIKTFHLDSGSGYKSCCTFTPSHGDVEFLLAATTDGTLEIFEANGKDLEEDHLQIGSDSSRSNSSISGGDSSTTRKSIGFQIDPSPLYEGYEHGLVLDSDARAALKDNESQLCCCTHTTEL